MRNRRLWFLALGDASCRLLRRTPTLGGAAVRGSFRQRSLRSRPPGNPEFEGALRWLLSWPRGQVLVGLALGGALRWRSRWRLLRLGSLLRGTALP